MKKLYKIVFYLLCTHTSNAQANYFESFDRTVNTLSDAVDVLVAKYEETTKNMIDVEKKALDAQKELQAKEAALEAQENQLQAQEAAQKELENQLQAQEQAQAELQQMKQAQEAAQKELQQTIKLNAQLQEKGQVLQQAQAALQAKGEELEQIKQELEQLKDKQDKQFQHLLQEQAEPCDDSQSEFDYYLESNQDKDEVSSSKDNTEDQALEALEAEDQERKEREVNKKLDKLNQVLAAQKTDDNNNSSLQVPLLIDGDIEALLPETPNFLQYDTAGSKNSNYNAAVDPEEQALKNQKRDDAEIDTDSTNSEEAANDSLLSSDNSSDDQGYKLKDFLFAEIKEEIEVPDNQDIEQQYISIQEKNPSDLDIAIQIVKEEEKEKTIDKDIIPFLGIYRDPQIKPVKFQKLEKELEETTERLNSLRNYLSNKLTKYPQAQRDEKLTELFKKAREHLKKDEYQQVLKKPKRDALKNKTDLYTIIEADDDTLDQEVNEKLDKLDEELAAPDTDDELLLDSDIDGDIKALLLENPVGAAAQEGKKNAKAAQQSTQQKQTKETESVYRENTVKAALEQIGDKYYKDLAEAKYKEWLKLDNKTIQDLNKKIVESKEEIKQHRLSIKNLKEDFYKNVDENNLDLLDKKTSEIESKIEPIINLIKYYEKEIEIIKIKKKREINEKLENEKRNTEPSKAHKALAEKRVQRGLETYKKVTTNSKRLHPMKKGLL